MRLPPADADGCPSDFLHAGFDFIQGHALHVFAGAFGHVFPFTLVHVYLGLPGAGVHAGDAGAIVLAGFGNAKTFFFLGGGSLAREQSQGHQAGGAAGAKGTTVHLKTPVVVKVAR